MNKHPIKQPSYMRPTLARPASSKISKNVGESGSIVKKRVTSTVAIPDQTSHKGGEKSFLGKFVNKS